MRQLIYCVTFGGSGALRCFSAVSLPCDVHSRSCLTRFLSAPPTMHPLPRFTVTKQQAPDTKQQSMLFQVEYPEIVDDIVPRHRFMSAYEQVREGKACAAAKHRAHTLVFALN